MGLPGANRYDQGFHHNLAIPAALFEICISLQE
jgi:hypothetical protein